MLLRTIKLIQLKCVSLLMDISKEYCLYIIKIKKGGGGNNIIDFCNVEK